MFAVWAVDVDVGLWFILVLFVCFYWDVLRLCALDHRHAVRVKLREMLSEMGRLFILV
jgi:hypothetical protein